uniref:Uncharacterized protein n=1 Tax=Anopheles quadriannulatus TaxID=34691 RepID=A0A182XRS4_ANOQN
MEYHVQLTLGVDAAQEEAICGLVKRSWLCRKRVVSRLLPPPPQPPPLLSPSSRKLFGVLVTILQWYFFENFDSTYLRKFSFGLMERRLKRLRWNLGLRADEIDSLLGEGEQLPAIRLQSDGEPLTGEQPSSRRPDDRSSPKFSSRRTDWLVRLLLRRVCAPSNPKLDQADVPVGSMPPLPPFAATVILFTLRRAVLSRGDGLVSCIMFLLAAVGRPASPPVADAVVVSSSKKSLSPGEQGTHWMLGSFASLRTRLFSCSIACHFIRHSRLWLFMICLGRAEM